MPYRLSCPACGKSIYVTLDDAGKPFFCRACGVKVVIPPGLGAPGEAQSVAEPDPFSRETSETVAPVPAPVPAPVIIRRPRAIEAAASEAAATRADHPEPDAASSRSRFVNSIAFFGGAAIVLAMTAGIWIGRALTPSTPAESPPTASGSLPPLLTAPATAPATTTTDPSTQFRSALLVKNEAEAYAAAGRLDAARASYRAFLLMAPQFVDLPEAREPIDQANADLARLEAMLQARQPKAPPATTAPSSAIANAPPTTVPATSPSFTATAPAPSTSPSTSPRQVAFDPSKPESLRTIPTVRLKPVDLPKDDLDAKIDESINRGVNFLLSQFGGNANALQGDKLNIRPADLNKSLEKARTISPLWAPYVMTVYALAAAGQSNGNPHLKPTSELMAPMLRTLRALNVSNHMWETYMRGVRCAALALCNRAEDRQVLTQDVNLLVRAGTRTGSHDYLTDPAARFKDPPAPRLTGRPVDEILKKAREEAVARLGDNSNSQFGTLGVWSGAEVGIEVPDVYWSAVEKMWQGRQDPDGGWCYRDKADSTLSMTSAGVASLYVTFDYLHSSESINKFATDPMSKQLRAGIAWLEAGDHVVSTLNNARQDLRGYELFALERAGLATGFKYFGTHDWYRELAKQVLTTQTADGSWSKAGDDISTSVIATSFHVLFLSRGRHPILMNKLEFEGNWCNRPRDLANAARFVSRNLEQPLNWQVVNTKVEGTDLLDSPILYISSDAPPKLKDRELAVIRDYVQGGGTVLLQPDGSRAGFKQWAPEFCRKVCPPYELVDLPAEHDLLNQPHRINPNKIHVKAASNGVRPLVILVDEDVAAAWQTRMETTRKEAFQFATNLFVFTTGKAIPRRRLQSPAIAKIDDTPRTTLHVARISYGGNWDPEPGAWKRFANLFQRETSAAIDVTEIPAGQLRPGKAVLAHLTGTSAYVFTSADSKAIHDYVAAGGVLLIDAAGGYNAFADTIKDRFLPQTFPGLQMKFAELTDPPLLRTQDEATDDLTKLQLETYAREKRAAKSDRIQIGRVGKGWVIFSPMDITHGLLGMHTWGVMGYTPETCKGIVKNILVWAGTMRESSPMPE